MITGGRAAVSFNPDPGYLFIPGSDDDSYNPTHVGELELSLRQPLLQGAGIAVNRAPIQISQVRSEQSAWEFKQAVMASVRSITVAYWDLHAARVALKSIDEVLPLLEEVVRLQEEAYKAEWTIYADVAKAYGQLHDYRQQRLDLQSEVVARELQSASPARIATRRRLQPDPEYASAERPAADRSDRRRAASHDQSARSGSQRLNVKIREVELFVAENGLLPRLDLRALYRLNGVGDDVGEALSQLSTAEYSDWLLGAMFSVPLGRRQATADARAAELSLARENALLQQTTLSVAYEVGDNLRRINYSYQEYQEAEQRSKAATDWVQGARLRYQNPNPEGDGQNWLLQSLNDYLAALRFRTDAATDAAAVLAKYNADLVRLEETKGTLLALFDIDLAYDPCRQLWKYGVPAVSPLNLESAPPPARLPPTAPAPAYSPRRPTSPGQSRSRSSRRRRPDRTSRCPPRRCSPGPLAEACPRPSPPRLLRRNPSPPLKPRRRKCAIRCHVPSTHFNLSPFT